MDEYNVLSNSAFIKIIYHAICGIIMLGGFADYLGKKNACSNKQKKSLFRKAIPWVLACILLSDLIPFVYRLTYYPWSEDPMPSQNSIMRELQYSGDDFIIFGWANDYQLAILRPLTGIALWTFWIVYTFSFKPSATSWWKKTYKVIAYIIISVSILGFRVHFFEDFLYWAIIIAVVIALLHFSSVRKSPVKIQKISSDDEQVKPEKPVIERHLQDSKEYNERFMPKQKNTEVKESPVLEKISENENSLLKNNVIPEGTRNNENMSELQLTENPKEDEKMLLSSQAEDLNITMMFCKYCGKRIEADSLYCKYCGKKL